MLSFPYSNMNYFIYIYLNNFPQEKYGCLPSFSLKTFTIHSPFRTLGLLRLEAFEKKDIHKQVLELGPQVWSVLVCPLLSSSVLSCSGLSWPLLASLGLSCSV